MNAETLVIRPFQPEDQEEVKALILSGLVDHWGMLDPTKNPDLNDIARSYADAVFLVARLDGRIVGTGALVPRAEGIAEIVRMSVASDMRRMGIGKRILLKLIHSAKARGFTRIILETTATWAEVIAFYRNMGFRLTHLLNGDQYFEMDLTA
jgi:ribosomal protein S18 acetylase RimI-like enzyme